LWSESVGSIPLRLAILKSMSITEDMLPGQLATPDPSDVLTGGWGWSRPAPWLATAVRVSLVASECDRVQEAYKVDSIRHNAGLSRRNADREC
jgi:hypothetical protein